MDSPDMLKIALILRGVSTREMRATYAQQADFSAERNTAIGTIPMLLFVTGPTIDLHIGLPSQIGAAQATLRHVLGQVEAYLAENGSQPRREAAPTSATRIKVAATLGVKDIHALAR
jgi:hypothetical protein